MPVPVLMIEFLDWLAARPRSYAETLDAWRTSCPRQSVWEDALLDGLTRVERRGTLEEARVLLTERGQNVLGEARKTKPF